MTNSRQSENCEALFLGKSSIEFVFIKRSAVIITAVIINFSRPQFIHQQESEGATLAVAQLQV